MNPVTQQHTPSRWRLLALGALMVVLFAGALVSGTVPRLQREREVNAAAAELAAAPPRTTVAVARLAPATAEQVLPGNALPLLEASIYARATGYLKTRLVDIGDRVKQGQLLAVIDAPDIDDQLEQARANLEQAKANLELAKANAKLAHTTLVRDERAGPGQGVSYLQYDQDRASASTTAAQVLASTAAIQVNQAAVQRYTDLQNFEKIVTPFPGIITARNVDPGDLLTADTPATAKELFHLMRTDILRVFVNVPQLYATGIKVGQDAVVYRQDEPQKHHAAKVARTADALEPNTRTLLTEVHVPNADNTLRPGMYLQVKFKFERSVVPIVIPAAALVIRSAGPRVGVLDERHRVSYRAVQLGRDYGAEIEVLTGLSAGETVVVHPGDDVPEGTVVEPVTPAAK